MQRRMFLTGSSAVVAYAAANGKAQAFGLDKLGAGFGYTGGRIARASDSPLLLDQFDGNGIINGRVPDVGPPWIATGAGNTALIANGGEMYQNSAAVAYAASTLDTTIGEIGCKFRLSKIVNSFTLSGTPTEGDVVVVQIWPSGETSAQLIFHTLTADEATSLATAAAAVAADIMANPVLAAAGISATATDATVYMAADQMPKIQAASATLGVSATFSPTPTLANYQTGQDFLAGMLHFIVGPDGDLTWTFYNGALVTFQALTKRTVGLSVGVYYTYRCCIEPPYVWGGVWDGSTLLSAAIGQDPNIATYNGASCFFETADQVGVLYYKETWAYAYPSVPYDVIADAVAP